MKHCKRSEQHKERQKKKDRQKDEQKEKVIGLEENSFF
jgi:hypothetical protein